jgi:very-short-patch-repair endonuclease
VAVNQHPGSSLPSQASSGRERGPSSATLPARGRVTAGFGSTIEPKQLHGTSPLAGEAGRGGATRSTLARRLRAQPSPVEVRLWRIIYGLRTNGYHFRKQVRLGSYVVGFACIHASLVIEVDGRTHDGLIAQANDAVRDDYLRGRGFTVLRLANRDVLSEPEGVYATIEAALVGRPTNYRGSPPPSPTLPARGRVPAGGKGIIEPNEPDGTSPVAGEDGRGGARRSTLPRDSR